MILKEFKEISLSDLSNLIENGVGEGKTLEYKQRILIDQDNDKKEFLFDVSSFANASGGDLIFGIEENRETGLPVNICGIESLNKDELIQKIESLIRDGIAPRISGINISLIPLERLNHFVLIIRIPKSWTSPHQVIFKGSDKFYTRATNGKYKLDILELRNAFILSDTITDRIRKFREERLSAIVSSETPVPLLSNAKIVLQFVPISSFEPNKNYDLTYFKSDYSRLYPLGGGGRDYRFNLEGMISYSSGHTKGVNHSYMQFYRNGVIETVNSTILEPYDSKLLIPSVPSINFEGEIIKCYKEYCKIIKTLQIDIPIFVFLSFVGIKGYAIESSKLRRGYNDDKITQDVLALPEIIIDSYDFMPEQQLRPLFDMVWNACGFEKSLNYDETGNWNGNK